MKMRRLLERLEEVDDPRRDYGNVHHKMKDILVIALCSTICGGEVFEDMEEFGETREEWLRTFLILPNGIPSEYTFRRVFERLESKQLMKCLHEWLENDPLEQSGGRAVNIDGKAIRGSELPSEGRSAYHVVSAWAHECGLTLGQLETDSKSNEIKAIPALLDMIDVRGDIVIIDAMGCQKDIAAKIWSKGADYVLAVKANHTPL